jgi:hypothetical protein
MGVAMGDEEPTLTVSELADQIEHVMALLHLHENRPDGVAALAMLVGRFIARIIHDERNIDDSLGSAYRLMRSAAFLELRRIHDKGRH